MATLEELIYNVKNVFKGGVTSVDDDLSDDQVAFWLATERGLLLKEDFEENKALNNVLIQDLGCISVECVDKVECCNLGFDSETTIYRTVPTVPKPIIINWSGIHNTVLFTYIGLATHDSPFEFTSEAIAHWSRYKKYTKQLPRSFYRHERIYITNIKNPSSLEIINIKGIFENPEDAKDFNKCTGEPCFTKQMSYPIASYSLSPLIERVLSKYLNINRFNPDKLNNAKDEK